MICPIKRNFKQSEDFRRKDKTSGEWIVEYFQKHPRHPNHGDHKKKIHSIAIWEKRHGKTGRKRDYRRIPVLRKNQFAERPVFGRGFCVLFFAQNAYRFWSRFVQKRIRIITGHPGTNPLVTRVWRENFILENSEKCIPQTGWREREFIRAVWSGASGGKIYTKNARRRTVLKAVAAGRFGGGLLSGKDRWNGRNHSDRVIPLRQEFRGVLSNSQK